MKFIADISNCNYINMDNIANFSIDLQVGNGKLYYIVFAYTSDGKSYKIFLANSKDEATEKIRELIEKVD